MQPPQDWPERIAPGERILWQGRPGTRILWGDMLALETAVGAGLWVCANLVTQTGRMIVGEREGYIFAGWALVFPLLAVSLWMTGVYLLVGRLFVDAWRRRRTAYALTDRAAYVTTGERTTRHGPEALADAELEPGDPGNIWFAERIIHRFARQPARGRPRSFHTQSRRLGFRQIPDAAAVYRQMAPLRGAA